ncbi:MAG TPA: hypothetical protein VIY29_21290 [Ktedonobacteraceae bacterium]
MRGKLRDKRPELKRDYFKRESLERRRTNKRDNRSHVVQLHQQYEQEDNFLLDEELEILVENTQK